MLLKRNKLIYGSAVTIWYLTQFIGAVACVNLYSDVERLNPCGEKVPDPDDASEVYDIPLLLIGIYHIVEWIRTAVLLTVVCIGVNWTVVWYMMIPNTIYGLVVYLFAHWQLFSDDGVECKDRAAWLLAEVIAFWVLFFIFAFPFLLTILLGKQRADDTLLKNWVEAQDDAMEEADGD